MYVGTLQFYGTIAAALASIADGACEFGDCGSQGPGPDPAPGGIGDAGEPGVEAGGAGAMH